MSVQQTKTDTVDKKSNPFIEWPIYAAGVSFAVMLLLGLAIFLWNKWSFVPLSGITVFLFLLSINPIGRYFRLLVSVVGAWGIVILNNAIDFGLYFKDLGIAWLKMNQIPWYIHPLIALIIVILALADIHVRKAQSGSQQSKQSLTKNRLQKYKMNLFFVGYLATFTVVALGAMVKMVGVQPWKPVEDKIITKQNVSIDRVADFRGSHCDSDGKPVDIAVFQDTVTLQNDSAHYTAFALESAGQFVTVFDISKSEEEPLIPTTTFINGNRYNTYLVSVNKQRQAKIKYVWRDSHYEFDGKGMGMLGITSKSYLSAASARILLPHEVGMIPDEQPFNAAVKSNCRVIGENAFQCTNLTNPDAVLFSFKWDLWANCRSS